MTWVFRDMWGTIKRGSTLHSTISSYTIQPTTSIHQYLSGKLSLFPTNKQWQNAVKILELYNVRITYLSEPIFVLPPTSYLYYICYLRVILTDDFWIVLNCSSTEWPIYISTLSVICDSMSLLPTDRHRHISWAEWSAPQIKLHHSCLWVSRLW